MKVTAERQENCIVQLTISVDERQEREYLRRAARALSRNYRLPGFRPGKAPYNVVVRRLGIDTVHRQVIEQFGDSILEGGLKESGLEPIAQASLEDVTWDPLALHLKVPVGPQVYLGQYRDIRIPWEKPQITDEDINQELIRLQKEQLEWRPDDRPAELGDQVVLDITGKVEDDVVIENTGREMVLNADSPYPVPGFAEAVVGMEPGETREFDLTYPEDHYNAEIAGQVGHFQVHLNEIRVEVLPLLDDEFALLVGDYEDLQDLKTKLGQSLQQEAETKAENEYEEQIWDEMLQVVSVEYPEASVEQEVERMKQLLEGRLQQQGMDLKSYFQLTNTTEEGWAAQIRPQAEDRLKRNLILAEIIKTENLQVEDEEIDAETEKTVEPMDDQADRMREILASPSGRIMIAENLLVGKALDRIKAIARSEEPAQEGEAQPSEEGEETTEPTEDATQAEEEAAAEAEEEEKAAEAPAEAETEALQESPAETETGQEPPIEAETAEEASTAEQEDASTQAQEPLAEGSSTEDTDDETSTPE